MGTVVPTLLLALVLAQDDPPGSSSNVRKPHPFAPSLPQLTDAEEKALDRVVDRLIEYDLGRLKGPEGKKAKQEFDDLGPEATFALMRGFNKAAKIDSSCPALVIGKKLGTILRSTNDRELLQFAKENLGAGVGKSNHTNVMKDLRLLCTTRQSQLSRGGATLRGSRPRD